MKKTFMKDKEEIELHSYNHGRYIHVINTKNGLFLDYQGRKIHLDLIYHSVDENIKFIDKRL